MTIDMHQRRDDAAALVADLRGQLERGALALENLERTARDSRASAVDERSVATAIQAEDAVTSRRRANAVLEESIASAQAQLDQVEGEIATARNRAERERQQSAARPLLEELLAEREAAIAGLLSAHPHLTRAAELAAQVGRELPMADQPEPLGLLELARTISARWAGPSHFHWNSPQDAAPEHDRRFRAYLREVLLGPLFDSQTVSAAQVFASLGIDGSK